MSAPYVASRSLAGRIGAFRMHAQNDVMVVSAPGRAASSQKLDERLLAEIDARDPGLSDKERERRLGFARKAHFAQLALASAKARKQNAIARREKR